MTDRGAMSDAGRTEAAARAEFTADRHTAAEWDYPQNDTLREAYRRAAEVALAAADRWDREHGIVRVDTRDEATLHLIAAALLDMPEVDPLGRVQDLTAAAQDLLSALSAGAQGEAQ